MRPSASREVFRAVLFIFSMRSVDIFFLSAQGHLPHPNKRDEGKQMCALTYLPTEWFPIFDRTEVKEWHAGAKIVHPLLNIWHQNILKYESISLAQNKILSLICFAITDYNWYPSYGIQSVCHLGSTAEELCCGLDNVFSFQVILNVIFDVTGWRTETSMTQK